VGAELEAERGGVWQGGAIIVPRVTAILKGLLSKFPI